ncbi:MAG: COX15/CtaA family protein [Gammaproteobacteria bacterium]|nr:COX15/CtaA family protein [Gammaproteobacteria bacterium]
MNKSAFFKLAFAATCLAYVVILLGAYTRLADAGLGCPDWPGCYGHVGVPKTAEEIAAANQAFPERPVEAAKAWKEMIHRYFASTLGLLIFALGIIAIKKRSEAGQPFKLPLFLMVLVVFQGLLGMWTVTIKVHPTIVMSHLMGGLTTLSLLWWLSLRTGQLFQPAQAKISDFSALKSVAMVGLIIVVLQVMLGGWTSSNYAALHCNEFPTCTGGEYFPPMNFSEGFTLLHEFGKNYEFGVMSNEARIAIHTTHRLGAVITALFVIWLGLKILLTPAYRPLKNMGIALLVIVVFQFLLGVSNIVFSLPLLVAVAHNGGGALLILALVTLNHMVRSQSSDR